MEFAEFIKIPMVDRVTLVRPGFPRIVGTLCITGHHMLFSSRMQDSEELMVLHNNVESVDRKLSSQGATLTISCKNFDIFQLVFPLLEDAQKVQASVEPLSVVETFGVAYPFFYQPTDMESKTENGWDLFGIDTYFMKMFQNTENWRLSSVNKDYKLCPSYPATVIVPRKISDDILKKSAAFRQHGRFPVLCYFHAAKKSCLMRSSQPASGITMKRCKEDEKLLNETLTAGSKGLVFDTRPMTSVYNGRSKGFGIEPDSNYPQWKKAYGGLARHREFSEMFHKYVEACIDTDASTSTWLSRLESSGWLKQLHLIINAGNVVASSIQKGATVLVHGGSGKDTTLIVSAFAQVLLDPQCRTVQGFQGLIAREWLSAGHPFRQRCIKLGTSNMRYKGQSPTFLMFLDAVFQVMQQYQCSFEFNDKFLQSLFENAYCSNYGTFLGDCEQDREKHNVRENTVSLWNHFSDAEILKPMLNPVYESNPTVLRPSSAPQTLTVWSGIFLRGQIDPRVENQIWDEVRRIQSKNRELKIKALELRRQYVEMQAKVRAKLAVDRRIDLST